MKKRLLALLLAGVLLVGSAGAAFSATKTYTPGQFTDVAANAWYNTSVKKVYELGLMSGSSATTFNPNGMFTVAEALTVAGRMHSLAHGGNGVMPAAGAWYQGSVNYCLQNKLITADQFDSYTRSATRSEMAGVIRAALPDDQWKAINSVSALPDVNMGNEYAQAIFDLYNAGVFTGSDDYGMFQPYAYITRAEVAAIVARCADPSQRKTLSLKPLSQRQAPELIGGYQSNVKMSNGRLAYKDPNTGKWGYLDGNGTAVIPAQYDKVEDFEAGYAKVQKNNWGLINTAGAVVLPLEQYEITRVRYDSNPLIWVATKGGKTALVNAGKLVTDYEYKTEYSHLSPSTDLYKVSQDKSSVITSTGKVILPRQSLWDLSWNGVYFKCNTKTASFQSNQYDVYDQNGVKLMSGLDDVTMANNNPLLVVKEGEKYAIAVGSKKITEAVYDYVWLIENSNFARVEYGDLTGLVGRSGVLLPPEKCSSIQFYDGLVYAKMADGSLKVLDETGVKQVYEAEDKLSKMDWTRRYGDYFFRNDGGYGSWQFGDLCDATGEKVAWVDSSSAIDLIWYEDGGDTYVINRAGETYGPYTGHMASSDSGAAAWNQNKRGAYLCCKNSTGTYDVFDGAGNMILRDGYLNRYEIRKNDAGKPIVAYGNEENGWTPVIEFYKNNMYYDEIKDIGEGYYACRFNTTWYLVHA